jgi:hypothetical protein
MSFTEIDCNMLCIFQGYFIIITICKQVYFLSVQVRNISLLPDVSFVIYDRRNYYIFLPYSEERKVRVCVLSIDPNLF